MTPRERFAADYGMPADKVDCLVVFARQAKRANEHACNGDPYGDVADKARASELWEAGVDKITNDIAELVAPYGFTAVAYTGLRPCLKRGSQYVEIPA